MGGGAPKQEQQMQQQSWANLNSLFDIGKQQGQQFGKVAQTDLDKVKSYFTSLLGPNKRSVSEYAAPAINTLTDATDAEKRERAKMGTARGGGGLAYSQDADSKTRAQIASLLGGTKTTLEGRSDQAATTLGGIGETELQTMLNSLGLSLGATGTLGQQIGSDINSRREAAASMWSSLIGGAFGLAGAFAGKPR